MLTIPSSSVSMWGLGGVNANAPSIMTPESNPKSYFTIYTQIGSSNAARKCYIFRKNGVAYQVTSGKTCYVVAQAWWAGTAGQNFQLLSATASWSDTTDIASLTGTVAQGGGDAGFCYPVLAANTLYQASFTYTFGAQTYPGVQLFANTAGSMWLLCYEA